MFKLVPKSKTRKLVKLPLVDMKVSRSILTKLEIAGMTQNKQKCLIFIVAPGVRVENQTS